MWKTVLRRVLIMIPEIIILSVFVFILAKMMPGDPFTGSITPQTSPARIHELKVQAGLYDPWYVQYGRWITNLFHGDLGVRRANLQDVSYFQVLSVRFQVLE